MAKSKTQKSDLLGQYKDMITNKGGYILVDMSSLNSASITELKKKLKEIGSDYSVVKNTVFKIALQETEQPVQTQDFDGPTAVISYSEDPTAPAKLLKELRTSLKSEVPLLQPRLGTLNGEYLDSAKVAQLENIPSREELIAKILGSLNAPLVGVMNTMSGNLKGFTMVIKRLSEKKA
jgi:large subunit ribosomal protein L10